MSNYTVLTSTGKVLIFTVKACADLYASAYKGVVITSQVLDNPTQYDTIAPTKGNENEINLTWKCCVYRGSCDSSCGSDTWLDGMEGIAMAKMGDLWIEIVELLENGMDPLEIAERLSVPVEWVEAVAG